MSTWILTTGNSDIRLKHDKNWGDLFDNVRDKFECEQIKPLPINPTNKEEGYIAPARALGLVYSNQADYYENLVFPLIDTFCSIIKRDNIKLDKIIVFLTDQSNIFEEWQRLNEKCPYWQDTLTLDSLLIKYFQDNLNITPEFKTLKPKSQEGLDHWNATLKLIEIELESLNIDSETVYISHQAGTPAISSAVQFASLGKFKNVQFLLSNQYYDENYNQQAEPEIVNSSEYWRGIQIQKAKQLILSGFPGAALKILEEIKGIAPNVQDELEKMVNYFNLNAIDRSSTQDFTIENATQRIINSLDLINFFFNHKNYLQGVALLAAAQETFLKVAILKKISRITKEHNGVSVSGLIVWFNEGLSLVDTNDLSTKFSWNNVKELNQLKQNILQLLEFPTTESYFYYYDKRGELFFKTNTNNAMLTWLSLLEPKFEAWENLTWSCNYYKDRESDLRNQLMHNLRGMEDDDVIKYLLGQNNKIPNNATVIEVYEQDVKKPFTKAIKLLHLHYKSEDLQNQLQKIASRI